VKKYGTIPEVTMGYFNKSIIKEKYNLYQNCDANELANIGLIIFDLFGIENDENYQFLKKLVELFIVKDMAEYDKML